MHTISTGFIFVLEGGGRGGECFNFLFWVMVIFFFKKFQCQVDYVHKFLRSKCIKTGFFFWFVLGDEPINELYHQKIKNIKVVGP
jgi:hypothetical protein